MTSPKLIWFYLALLGLGVLAFRLSAGAALDDAFSDQVSITSAQPIEQFSGAKAGRVVELPPEMRDTQHLVKRGDSWASIARQHGVKDYNALAKHHDFLPLRPGMTIKIPAHLMEEL